ncbi:MAG: putative blue pigment (indigoidine) exporter [Halobacteriales archaeon]|jgi:probable blue pigment (indigoidine) exporter
MDRPGTVGRFASLAALWWFSFVATRATVQHVPPVLLAALRFDVAGLVVLAFAAVTADRWRPRTRADWIVVGLGGAFFVAAPHALLFAGQQYVSSAVAGVVISLDPVLAAASPPRSFRTSRSRSPTSSGSGSVFSASASSPTPTRTGYCRRTSGA